METRVLTSSNPLLPPLRHAFQSRADITPLPFVEQAAEDTGCDDTFGAGLLKGIRKRATMGLHVGQ
jgi:hypothetical protein